MYYLQSRYTWKAFPPPVPCAWVNVGLCEIYEKQDYRSYLYLTHSSTAPAVFLQMFETPLLFSLFYLAAHILPTRIISKPTSNSLYSPELIVFPNQTLAPVISSFSDFSLFCFSENCLFLKSLLFIMFFRKALNHQIISHSGRGGVCTTHLSLGIYFIVFWIVFRCVSSAQLYCIALWSQYSALYFVFS